MLENNIDEKTIHVSFKNITKLYDQVSKMLYEMDRQFGKEKFFPNQNNQNAICRWRSDQISEIYGWRVGDIARSYYFSAEEENTEDNKQIVININMSSEIPHLTFGIYTYDRNISNYRFGIGDHWYMYWPLYQHNNKDFVFDVENEYMLQSRPANEKASKRYLDLINSKFISVRLFEIKDKESLNSLVVLPAAKLFKGEELEIESLNNSRYISSKDYLKLNG